MYNTFFLHALSEQLFKISNEKKNKQSGTSSKKNKNKGLLWPQAISIIEV